MYGIFSKNKYALSHATTAMTVSAKREVGRRGKNMLMVYNTSFKLNIDFCGIVLAPELFPSGSRRRPGDLCRQTTCF